MERGVVPFENSTNGSVVYTLDLFADRTNAYPDISVCGEAYLDVHHHLLGYPASVQSDVNVGLGIHEDPLYNARPPGLRHIKRLYSHPQAFGQCEIYLQAHLRGVERHEVSSTSKAAELVAMDKSRTSAAIASRIAADVHNLGVLDEGIEDREDNTTRFLIIQKGISLGEVLLPRPDRLASLKTLVSFTVDHRAPGALADVLLVFREHGLNLTSINSRPSRVRPWHYIFFVEFFQSAGFNGQQEVMAKALTGLFDFTEKWRWLGSWEDHTAKRM